MLKVEVLVVVGGLIICVCMFGGMRLVGRVVGKVWVFGLVCCCWIRYMVMVNLFLVKWFVELILVRF